MKNNLPYRPILHLRKSNLEKVLDGLGIVLFGAAIIFLIINWHRIPDHVPIHFKASGEADRFGSKVELVVLPIIGLFIFVLMSLLEKAPHMHNYPVRINESNVERFYLHSRKLLNIVKNVCLWMFSYLIIQIGRVSLGELHSLSIGFVPVFLFILFGTIGIGLYKQTKIK
ncbi:DUF1648 domain-containing protein [Ureibacillus sinduriensis]|uniref:DUF1648 domain-containing protein n=1 Tax=Ureibacillus sinduriensis BLB-1 = JCM 15800 TaxID=1384057 RepID=A0A0A3HTX7_9BACL|nr:DUF1648 domain-containing protein [Ureibacillus sinduriensis]KGR74680.1 hypothetical protein CD33_16480 [Ureibacillus sinduriensis BLB-1 = JCM 15800]